MRRDLAGRAVLIAAGVGTALGAGAGLANAAPLEQDLQPDQSGTNAFDQTLPTDALTGALPQAPNLSLNGLDPLQAASPLDLASVSGDQLAGLGTSDQLGGIASNGGNVEQAEPADAGQAGDATDATDATDSSGGGDGDSGAGDYTATYGDS